MVVRSTQPLTKMCIRNLPRGKGRPARKMTTSPPCVSRLYRKYVNLDVSQPYGPSWLVTGITLHFLDSIKFKYRKSVLAIREIKGTESSPYILFRSTDIKYLLSVLYKYPMFVMVSNWNVKTQSISMANSELRVQFITHMKLVRTISEIYQKAWKLSLPMRNIFHFQYCGKMLWRLKISVSVTTFSSLHLTRKETWTCLMYCISNTLINSCIGKTHYATSHTFKAINGGDKSVQSLPCYCSRRCSVLRLTYVQIYCDWALFVYQHNAKDKHRQIRNLPAQNLHLYRVICDWLVLDILWLVPILISL
jgi:hypothetical protein